VPTARRELGLENKRANVVALAALAAFTLASLCAVGVALGAPPSLSASFTYSPASPAVSQTVMFVSTTTHTQNDTIKRQDWDLDGDGQFDDATGNIATRAFLAPGTHTVGLQAIDKNDAAFVATRTVSVHALPPPDQPPRADFVKYPSDPGPGDQVTFYSVSTDLDSPIVSQLWDLNGDGVFGDASGPSASRVFASAGIYTVGLRVVDTAGAFSIATQTVTVSNRSTTASTPSGGTIQIGTRRYRLMAPFPVVRISGTIEGRGTRIRRLTISAPSRAKITVRCRGRGCPFRRRARSASASSSAPSAYASAVRIRRLEGRLLRPGVLLRVLVTKPETVGKYTRFKIRRLRPPSRIDRCLVPGLKRPIACPG
jgi:PKD repeat protein